MKKVKETLICIDRLTSLPSSDQEWKTIGSRQCISHKIGQVIQN